MSSACESEPIAAVLCAGQPRKPHIALCLGGAARTFVQPLVHRSIYEHVIRALGANVVVFACLSSEDAKPWKAVPAIHHNRSRVDAALRAIGVPAHQAHVDEAGCEASSGAFARCANYTAHPEAPPDGMFGKTLFSKSLVCWPARAQAAVHGQGRGARAAAPAGVLSGALRPPRFDLVRAAPAVVLHGLDAARAQERLDLPNNANPNLD